MNWADKEVRYKVSIITVCFNSAATIRDTIESVLSQDYPEIEYIIVDGASRDGTLAIVNEYRNQIATVISEPDDGIYDAMNKGITVATGHVVGILNSDDFYSDNHVIKEVVKEFVESNVDSVYADLAIISRDDKRYLRYYGSGKFTIKHIRFGWMIPHPTFFVKRKYYEKFGLYRTNYRVAADFELLARFLWRERISHKRIPKCIINMRHGGISSHGLWWRFHQNLEIVRACRENDIRTNIFIVLLKTPFKLLEYLRPIKPQE